MRLYLVRKSQTTREIFRFVVTTLIESKTLSQNWKMIVSKKRKDCWRLEIKNIIRIAHDVNANREEEQLDKFARQKIVNEHRNYELVKHEKNFVEKFDEQISICQQIFVEAQKRQCINRREHNDWFRLFMKNKIALIILQYNVWNEKMRTIIFLLIDNNVQNYDVIVIQKLWRNLFVSITLSFNQNDFHLFYKFEKNPKVCFYVNNQIDTKN
jgi:hypothetical protein